MPDRHPAPDGPPPGATRPHADRRTTPAAAADASPTAGTPMWSPVAKTVLPGLILGVLALVENTLWGDSGLAVWEGVLTAVIVGTAVCLRQRSPVLSLFVVAAVVMTQALARQSDRTTPILLSYLAALTYMAYSAGHVSATRRAPGRGTALLTGVLLIGSAVTAALVASADAWLFALGMLVIFGIVPGLFGRDRSRQRELVHAGWSEVAHLEREQRIIAQQTRLQERARIAQDMHDSLGHELSLIALRAGALEMAPNLDEAHRAVFSELRSAVSAATERLAEIIGVLSDESDPAAVAPAHDDIDNLVERARASGMEIELLIKGEGHRPPVMVERATYRVLQESLTNAAKHAPGAAVTVVIAHSATETVVTVTNDRPTGGPLPPKGHGQRGLIGLKERARLLGGTLDAGPCDGMYQVMARLPHGGMETGGAT
jgi:signal transduction histidine kinase